MVQRAHWAYREYSAICIFTLLALVPDLTMGTARLDRSCSNGNNHSLQGRVLVLGHKDSRVLVPRQVRFHLQLPQHLAHICRFGSIVLGLRFTFVPAADL